MTAFHSEDYISFLSRITPDNLRNFSTQMSKFNAGEFTDCPVFDNLFEFTQIYSGCSIDAAIKVSGTVEVGGRRSEATFFETTSF